MDTTGSIKMTPKTSIVEVNWPMANMNMRKRAADLVARTTLNVADRVMVFGADRAPRTEQAQELAVAALRARGRDSRRSPATARAPVFHWLESRRRRRHLVPCRQFWAGASRSLEGWFMWLQRQMVDGRPHVHIRRVRRTVHHRVVAIRAVARKPAS